MSASNHHRTPDGDDMAEQASLWLARRDRGLTAEEQDAYIQWLTADPRHADELARHAAAFQRMMRLHEWQPGQSTEPNPDLFAPRRRWRTRPWWLGVAAAVVGVFATIFFAQLVPSPRVAQSYLRLNESRVLPDGSVVELKEGSAIKLAFSDEVRRVWLSGEAHFTVAKSAKPFVVEAGEFVVRAVGTAFNVRLDANEVDVLVTEGTVQLDRTATDTASAARSGDETAPSENPSSTSSLERVPEGPVGSSAVLVAGQRGTVPRIGRGAPRVSAVSPAEIERALGWQTPRLEFSATPLVVAVAEFNQRNRTRLVLADPSLESIPIGGSFRVDNVEGFVRLLEVTLDIRAETRAGGKIILSRRR